MVYKIEKMNCLNCGKEVKQTEGKRQRKYCNDACKQIHWKKTNKKEPKYVQYKTFKELLDKFNSLSERDNQLINAARGRDESGINLDEIRPEKQKNNKIQSEKDKKVYTLADMPKDLGFFQKRQWLLNHGLKEK